MRDLERELRALELEWPPTPDLATAVETRLAAAAGSGAAARQGASAAARHAGRRTWLARGVAALVVLIAGGLTVSPAARSALRDLLGLHGAEVRRAPVPPHPRERPGRLGAGLGLGRPVTLAEARARVRFRLTLPPLLGAPDAVWLAQIRGQPARASLIYGRRPDIPVSRHTNVAVLVTEFRATVTPVLQKALGAGARLTQIPVAGARAYAITGQPHGFAWMPPSGQPQFEQRRLAGTTLLVERDDGVLLRAEGELRRQQLERLAQQLARPV